MASKRASSVLAFAFLNKPFTFEKASLPLYASSRYIFWMTPLGAEDGLRRLAYRWLSRNCPSASVEVLTANRDRREESLCRELSAGSSEGKLLSTRNGEVLMDKAWVGVDAGKEFHWAHVLDASGRELLSRKVENDEADISKLIDEALSLAEEVLWAVDQPGGGAALLLALLWERDQRVLYIPGLTVDRARDTYRGESKTDARDARVIADQARMRSDLGELKPGEEEVAQLRILLGRRRDLVIDQTRGS
jgi:hypothetical protein